MGAGEPAEAHCGNAWVWLGAAGQATTTLSIGTAVTGVVHRYNPVVVVAGLVAGVGELWRRWTERSEGREAESEAYGQPSYAGAAGTQRVPVSGATLG